jgi:hypothetical protein
LGVDDFQFASPTTVGGYWDAEIAAAGDLCKLQEGHDTFNTQAIAVYERLGGSDLQLRILRRHDSALDQAWRKVGAAYSPAIQGSSTPT